MKLGIMQPYFFPHIAYFQLINAVDQWVIFDTPQYIRHGWVNRNRILHPQAGPKYILLPLAKHSKNVAIGDVLLHPVIDWKPKIMAQLHDYYRNKAPNFKAVLEMVDSALDADESSLARLLMRCLTHTCEYIGLEFDPIIASELNINSENVLHAGQWALVISKSLSATEYVNPVGGRELFNPAEFEDSNITLSFLESNAGEYDQGGNTFYGGLSILDVLMWNSKDETKTMLGEYSLKSG